MLHEHDTGRAFTLLPRATSCRISSTTAVVLPVPGGPWMSATSLAARALETAATWLASSPWLNGFQKGGLLANLNAQPFACLCANAWQWEADRQECIQHSTGDAWVVSAQKEHLQGCAQACPQIARCAAPPGCP